MLVTFLMVKHSENWILLPGNFSWCCLIITSRHITFVTVSFAGSFQTTPLFLSTNKVVTLAWVLFFFFNLTVHWILFWIVLWEPFLALNWEHFWLWVGFGFWGLFFCWLSFFVCGFFVVLGFFWGGKGFVWFVLGFFFCLGGFIWFLFCCWGFLFYLSVLLLFVCLFLF